jgi:hypothetical protein
MYKRWILTGSIVGLLAVAAGAQEIEAAGRGTGPDLAAWWKFDEASGTQAADASGQGNDGTLRGGPIWVQGFQGGALQFDGTNDYVAIDNLKYNRSGVPAVTVATWLRTDQAADQYIISFDRNEYWVLVVNGSVAEDGQIGWLVTTNAGPAGIRSSARVDDGNWHHVAAVFDNGRLAIYVDGSASGAGTAGTTLGRGVTRYGFIGTGSLADRFDGAKNGAPYFHGALDDLRIYNRALSPTEIAQLAFRGPGNDACANAQPIGEVDKLPFDTRPATLDGLGLFIKSPNLWYLYSPSAAGLATVSLAGSSFDTMVAVYRGAAINPGRDRLVAVNDDFHDLTSQVTFEATAGQVYLIEVGGYDSLTGEGLLTVSVEGATPGKFDLGDAPDSTNGQTKRMTAYAKAGLPVVDAHFPTVFDDRDSGPRGPLHLDPVTVAHLGRAVSLEMEAAQGPDEDKVNNINPARDEADKDGADDGVSLPLQLPNGAWTSFEYTLSVVQPDHDLWVNVWFDWNRDGDWDDDSVTDPAMIVGDRYVSEWAVQNQFLYSLPTGTYQVETPGFLAWHPDTGPNQLWMRITLSEKPWKGGTAPGKLGNGGSGPAEGYEVGETEDYLITPEVTSSVCQDLNHDGKIDFSDLIELINQWYDSCVN